MRRRKNKRKVGKLGLSRETMKNLVNANGARGNEAMASASRCRSNCISDCVSYCDTICC